MATKGKRQGGRGRSRVSRPKSRMVHIVGGGTRSSRDRKDSGGGMAAERHRREKVGSTAKTAVTVSAVQRMSDEERQKRASKNAMCRTRHKEQQKVRRVAAEERQAWWVKLPAAKQLRELDKRLGRDVGAVKQRARLREAIEQQKQQEAP